MVMRITLLGVLLVMAFGTVWVAERWRGRPPAGPVPVGLTLVSSPGCRDCLVARERFDALGIRYRVIGVDMAESIGLRTFTMPMAFVGSASGDVVIVRRGGSVVSDVELLVAAIG
jgi:hypothetical protein